MATISLNQLSVLELMRGHDAAFKEVLPIAEVLTENNPILQDAPWEEANEGLGHVSLRETALPTGSFRAFNEGVATEEMDTEQIRDVIGMLETRTNTDVDLLDKSPSPNQFRFNRVKRRMEGVSQTFADTIIYGNNATAAKSFTGLAPRLATVDSVYIRNNGGTGSDLTSIYGVKWGMGQCYLVYPRGSKTMGLRHIDLGQQSIVDSNGNYYEAIIDKIKIDCGLVVEDPRCIGRLANIEASGANSFDPQAFIKFHNRMKKFGTNGLVYYVSHNLLDQIEIYANEKGNMSFNMKDGPFGMDVLTFRGVPIKVVDAIVDTETAIS